VDSLNPDPTAVTDSKLIMEASAMMIDGNLSTRWMLLVPRCLQPILFRLFILFPTPSMRKLQLGRDRLISLGMALSRNALKRLGQEWVDEIGMEACRECAGARPQQPLPQAAGAAGAPLASLGGRAGC
jgi:hypothetical protein